MGQIGGVVVTGDVTEIATVVTEGVVVASEAYFVHDVDDEDIADDGHHRGGGGGRQPEGADFRGTSGEQDHVGGMGKGAVGVAGNDNERKISVEIARKTNQVDDFGGLSGIGDEEHHVVGTEDAEVAVLGFGRVKEDGGSACGTKCGGNVHGNLSGLTHTGSHELTTETMDAVDNSGDSAVVVVGDGYGGNSPAFGQKNLPHRVFDFSHQYEKSKK